MTQLILTYVSPNEVSLGNTEDIQFLCRSQTYDLPIGSTIYCEDAGTYEIRIVGTGQYLPITVEARAPDDGTPGRVVLNRQEEIGRLRDNLSSDVDNAAERLRHQFITPGAGQAMTYEEKYDEALAYLADSSIDEAEIPHIVAEVGITGADKESVATSIVTMRNQWKGLSAEIERIRLGRKKEIAAAETVETLSAFTPVDWSSVSPEFV